MSEPNLIEETARQWRAIRELQAAVEAMLKGWPGRARQHTENAAAHIEPPSK